MTVEQWKKSVEHVGENIASLYGGEYEDCEILDNGDIRFYYLENGEGYYSDLKPQQLQQFDY